MQITKPNIQSLSTTTLIFVGVLVWVLSCGNVAIAGSYSDSAHGDALSGVNRSSATCENWPEEQCVTGSCAHCHDTFDPSICGDNVNGLMLFASNENPSSQTDNFCFQCHKGSGSVQVGGITNNDYGATFGGGTAIFDNIYDAFNPSGIYASSHDLATLQNYAKNTTWGTWMTDNTNACTACHDQHFSQKNFPGAINLDGGVNTAVRRGNDVNDYPGDLWGDEPEVVSGRPEMMSDLMSDWSTTYQAPYYVGGSDYEPANDGTVDGSNLPNFVWACAETCHRLSADGREPVNWQTSNSSEWPGHPSQHGRKAADSGTFGDLKAPYSEGSRGSYVLSCTDCHEPHGSTNSALLRTTVNGVSGLQAYQGTSEDCRWYNWCSACHDLSEHTVLNQHPDPTELRCGQYVGCHMSTGMGGTGGNHGHQF